MPENNNLPTKTEFLIYQTSDGRVRIETRLQRETVWLNQKQMAELFQRDRTVITKHIRNIFKEQELEEKSVCALFAHTAEDGKTYNVEYYNLDLIISVGYRIKSPVATHFRQWATQRLREYIVKGFAMDDERLKQSGGGAYFDELLARIRDIRSSEKVFWRKVLDIYSTSIDYDPKTDVSKEFFKVIQNKMHWAAHGHTAAEVIYNRADAERPHMGMTNWSGEALKKTDAEVAKNYLNEAELDVLNRIVSMYLDFAELQALNRKPMTMRDWIVKLDEFMKLTGRDILTHAGRISHDKALEKAHEEYDKYRMEIMSEPSPVEKHFIEAEQELKQLESKSKRKRKAKDKDNDIS